MEPYYDYLGKDGSGSSEAGTSWYQEFHKAFGRKPSDMEILNQGYHLAMNGEPIAEMMPEELAEMREQLEALRGELSSFDKIQDKMKTLTAAEITMTREMTSEGIQVYNKMIQALTKAQREANIKATPTETRVSANLFARRAEQYAEAMRSRKGNPTPNYSALDYFKDEFAGVFGGKRLEDFAAFGGGKAYHQPITADINLDDVVPVVDLSGYVQEGVAVSNKDLEVTLQGLLGEGISVPKAEIEKFITLPMTNSVLKHIARSAPMKRQETRQVVQGSLNNIVEVLENSVFVEKSKNMERTGIKQNADSFYRFFVPLKIKDKYYTLSITAFDNLEKLSFDGKLLSLYELSPTKKKKEPLDRYTGVNLPNQEALYDSSINGEKKNVNGWKRTQEGRQIQAPQAEAKPDTMTIRDMLAGLQDKSGQPYINEDGSGNFGSYNQSVNITETKAFKEWFGDSKVVDENGRPLVVYHQTNNTFEVFDPRHRGAGAQDSDLPFGIYMKPTSEDVGVRGDIQMPLYARIENPITFETRTEVQEYLKNNIPEYGDFLEKIAEAIDDKKYAEFWHQQKEAGSIGITGGSLITKKGS